MLDNPYKTLGLQETATRVEAERAWKKAVRRLHPDQHPEADRDRLTAELALINQAWAMIEKGMYRPNNSSAQPEATRNIQEIALNYSSRDATIKTFLDSLRSADAEQARSHFLRNLFPTLMKGKLPKLTPLRILLCAGVLIEGKTLSFLFHSPIPPGRSALIMPKIRKTGFGINVLSTQPEALMLDLRSVMHGTYAPFESKRAADMDLETINILLPPQNLDITKSFTLTPPTGFSRIYYT